MEGAEAALSKSLHLNGDLIDSNLPQDALRCHASLLIICITPNHQRERSKPVVTRQRPEVGLLVLHNPVDRADLLVRPKEKRLKLDRCALHQDCD
jgi:hypothetical protein